MTTRAATFNAKLRNVKDYHYRIVNNVAPLPSGIDIANTLKFFSQTLLSVLKDVPSIPAESYGPRQRDSVRLSIFPNLNYNGLYQSLISIIEIVPIVQHGQAVLGEAVLSVLGCLVPFLEYDLLDSLPYTFASTFATFPPSLHKDTVDLLCTNLLPMTLGYAEVLDNPTYASDSAACIIMMAFQHVENRELHSKLVECLMSLKKNICKDLLMVIAYGPPQSRAPVSNLLFHYWPQLNQALTDRRSLHHKYLDILRYTGYDECHGAWKPMSCQRQECPNSGNSVAVKMCLDPAPAIEYAEKPPPIYLCSDCVEHLRRNHQAEHLVDLLLPMDNVALVCENKNCISPDNMAVCTCFSMDCASFNGNRPIRFCEACHLNRHKERNHVVQLSIPKVWDCEPEMQSYLVEAIVSLLKEAQPMTAKRYVEMGDTEPGPQAEDEPENDGDEDEDQRLLSRYGIWLLIDLCPADGDIPLEILGRLIAMLFQWFDATAYLPDGDQPRDNVGSALERLKPGYVCNWLKAIVKKYFEVVVSCLLPHPVEYARVGGHWDTLASRTSQIKEGLNRLFCLIPYDVITFDIWDYVMPYWLEAIRTEVPEDELRELKVMLCKVFDLDMCPLPFPPEQIFKFLSDRFEGTTSSVQEQALLWLQILSMLEIICPLHLMVQMFQNGITSVIELHTSRNKPKDFSSCLSPGSAADHQMPPLTPDLPSGQASTFLTSEPVTDDSELNLQCFVYMLDLISKQAELQESPRHQSIFHDTSKEIMLLITTMTHAKWSGEHTCQSQDDQQTDCWMCQQMALWNHLVCKVVEFITPREPVRLPDKEVPKIEEIQNRSHEGVHPHKASLDEKDEEPDPQFDLKQMPVHLQLIHALLLNLTEVKDKEATYYLIKSLKLLCLHAESLNYAAKDNEEFVKYCLRKLLLPNLWKLLQGNLSHIASVSVPLLLHCMTLPSGADVFWKLIEADFGSDDWKSRFAAVEKVSVLARLLEEKAIRNNQPILTSLAHAFCYLIGSLDDMKTAVAQKTLLYLETIKVSSYKCICTCLEFQFDTVINDRCMILQRMYQLFALVKHAKILSWEFFLNRFDTLSLEAQLDLESSGDIAYPTDLASSNRDSEHFLRKLNRAKFALARTDSVRSVSESFMAKPPYRRACSVPLHLVAKTIITPSMRDKEKSYVRQQSAPQFNLGRRRQSSFKYGAGMFAFQGGHLKEFTDEESNFAALLQRAMDLEGVDRDTVHMLVGLLMRFMACEESSVSDERASNKAQSIVLRHVNVLLGYNQAEKGFSVPPFKLRCSTVFNAFLSGLPYVLDRNFTLGNHVLGLCLSLLAYCPSPQRYASDYQPPNFTLWYLEPHTRLTWLQVFLVVLYKYQYVQQNVATVIQTLIRIVINTVEAQHHRCRRLDDTYGPASPVIPRTRDTSNVSVGDLEQIQETDTPPQSPTDSQLSSADAVTINVTTPSKSSSVKYSKLKSDEDGKNDETASDLDSSPAHTRPKKKMSKKSRSPRRIFEYPYEEKPSSKPEKMVKSKSEESSTGKDETLLITMEEQGQGQGHETRERGRQRCRGTLVPRLSLDSNMDSKQVFDKLVKQKSLDVEPLRALERHGEGYPMPLPGKSPDSPIVKQFPCKPPPVSTLPSSPLETIMDETDTDSVSFTTARSTTPSRAVSQEPESVEEAKKTDDDEAKVEVQAQTEDGINERQESFETARDVDAKIAEQIREFEGKNLEEPAKESEESVKEPVEEAPKEDEKVAEIKETDFRKREDVRSIPDSSSESYTTTRDGSMSDKASSSISDTASEKMPLLRPILDAVQGESELEDSPSGSPRLKPNFRQRKARKTGLTTVDVQKMIPEGEKPAEPVKRQRKQRKSEILRNQVAGSTCSSSKKASSKYVENLIVERCPDCHAIIEQYDEEVISQSIVCLRTFVHREPSMAAPYLLDMLQCVARIASPANGPYSWQQQINGLVIPGNSTSVARQFLRCTLHQLAPNGIFPQLFLSRIDETDFMKTVASALADFQELNCYAPLQLVLEGVNNRKSLQSENVVQLLENLASYLECLTLEVANSQFAGILTQFDVFFRKLPLILPNPCDMNATLKIMLHVLKMPGLSQFKAILEPFSKLLSFMIQNCSFKLETLVDLCSFSNRAFTKDRDRLLLCRSVIFELVQALKFKSILPDENLMYLVQFVVMDAGGTIGPTNIVEGLNCGTMTAHAFLGTSAADAMRHHLNDCVEFIADLHTINKVKTNMKGGTQNLNEDTLGSHLKAAIAQFTALEFTRSNGRDSRAVTRYLPWLYHPPSAMQQGPKEFIDCVGHIRLLSWILIGSLTHTAVCQSNGSVLCQPIPLEASNHIADHIMVIMTGFAEQSKASVLHMSSLFHAFILCQLWTMYCESAAVQHTVNSESYLEAHGTVMDFWGRVTPGVLQLLSHSKVLAEMVNLHFLSLMEALQECHSVVLTKLFALWTPILFTHHAQLPGHLQVRLQTCQNWEPPKQIKDASPLDNNVLLKWLKRLQFKLGQIEVQSSAATQFYTV